MPTIFDLEKLKVKGRAYHRMSVHRRAQIALLGLALLGYSAAFIGHTRHLGLFRAGVLIETIALSLLCLNLFIPCKCEGVAISNAKSKLSKMRRHPYVAINGLTELFLLSCLISSTAVIPALLINLGYRYFAEWVWGLEFVLMGLAALVMSARNKVPLRHHIVMSANELQQLVALRGDTEEDLHRLVDFHLKTGDHDLADDYSRKLLALSENHTNCPQES